ncbi:MAG: ATP synthase subunit I [Opitutales bacterium]
MNNVPSLLWALLAGLLLGSVFFGGLLWTVRKGVASPHPVLWFLGSLLLRLSLVVAGFYLVGQGDAWRLGACLVGFIIARLIITQLSAMTTGKTSDEPQS